ncbi:MAG: hypothetical protein HN793_02505 [Rhodospirillaceae bacterium]|jgi:surface carbohydrate biosynthesis protein|nr:hypothetical protein [Rhodospirillaceae bacterium]MBT5564272.1 hypothetical protein [Rhodospirillaceae bacterium]MBT6088837.1 hypothetical protein [Rhodospirillaceae bacterium]MBT6961391.1 hypothetical protein [Rhodospirillaceae bacterium]MBT7449674.1 hypothetical protein [Rhodospirillaceae bacterium]
MNPVVYISLELKARDLDARLLVAAEAVKLGLNVVIGQQWALSKNFYTMPTGVFLFKTVNEIQAGYMKDAAAAGHAIAASDEEVLACACDACFESGMGPTAAEFLDVFFAQGQRHADTVISQYPKLSDRVCVTGNPRIDLLTKWGRASFENKAAEIRNEVGTYILFNTNFGWINSIWNAREDTKQIAIRTGHLVPDDPASVAAYETELDWERTNMAELEKVVEWMQSGLPGYTAVIRPHPAEDPEYWKAKYSSSPHVLIANNTPHIPWTLGSTALVHTTCSTGMEAALLDIPALSITPRPNAPQHAYIMSNLVNPTVQNAEQAIGVLTPFIQTGSGPMTETGQYLDTLDEFYPDREGGTSAAQIADGLINLIKDKGGIVDSSYSWALNPGQPWYQLERRQEWRDKFTVENQEFAVRLKAMTNLAGLNQTVGLQKLDDSLFLMYSK